MECVEPCHSGTCAPHELVVVPYGTGNDFFKMISKNNDSKEVLKASLKGKTIFYWIQC